MGKYAKKKSLFLLIPQNSYSNPYSKINHPIRNRQSSLKVTTIALPRNIKTFNTGSSLQKWKNKRAPIKSSTAKRKTPFQPSLFDDFENFEETQNPETELDSEIQRFFSDSQRRDSSAEKCKAKKKKSKIIRVSLSKPPSPETIQVIRVDVVSNFSVEEVEKEDEESDEGMEIQKSEEDFVLMCHKLALAARS